MDLELGDLTVFVGRNGAGKSNTTDVLRFLRDCIARGFEQALLDRGGLETIRRQPERELLVGIGVEHSDWRCRYSIRFAGTFLPKRSEVLDVRLSGDKKWTTLDSDAIEQTDEGRPGGSRPDTSVLTERGSLGLIALFQRLAPDVREVTQGWIDRVKVPQRASLALSNASFYDLSPGSMKSPQRVVNSSPFDEEGANLVAVLRSVLSGRDGDTVRQALRLLVDGATDIDVQGLGAHLIAEVVYGASGDGEPQRFDLGLESDGTIRLVAILAALYQSPPRTLVVIEEPERNIHPGALAVLASVLKEASTRMQVVVTTHSPDLIDHMDPDDIRVVERVDGATVVGRMDPIQRGIIRDKLFTTGEMMRIQGLLRDEG